jgi:hypothetical protein
MVKTRFFRRCFLLIPVLALMTIATVDAEDGWRRTAQGWEKVNIARARVAFSEPLVVAKSDPIHPGQLGILQVAGSCLVLALFASQATIVRTAD